ncbi:MAG: hypothetical protein H6765_10905 [Candidatus Peribacteria bacterium]|nr:MAG: hypothetical protein H6765_10905 [Candidatus Peribacteria bacterium]
MIAVPGILSPIESKVADKRNDILLQDMYVQMQQIAAELEDASGDFSKLFALYQSLLAIQSKRSQIQLPNTAQDTELFELLALVKERIAEYQNEHEQELLSAIEKQLEILQEYLDKITFLPQITSVYGTRTWATIEEMAEYLQQDKKQKVLQQMQQLVLAKQHALSHESQQLQKQQQLAEQSLARTLEQRIQDLAKIVASYTDPAAVSHAENADPLAQKIRKDAEALPIQQRDTILLKLQSVFTEKLFALEAAAQSAEGVIKSLDKYGIPLSLYYSPEVTKRVKRDIKGTQIS